MNAVTLQSEHPVRWHQSVPLVAIIALVVVTTGVVALSHAGRAAFYDEAWVIGFARAQTLAEGLAQAYNDRQPIAVGYLAFMHGLAELAGGRMWAYRLVSAGFMLAMVLAAGAMAGRWARYSALGFAAALLLLACPLLQRYATEIKQYLPAAALSVGLILAADRWVNPGCGREESCQHGEGKRCGRGAWVWFVLALAGVMVSFAAWFAVAGTGAVVFAVWLWRRDRAQIITTVVVGLMVMIAAAAVHLLFNRHISGSNVLADYWGDLFLPRDMSWPVAAWHMGAGLFEQAWYRYTVPGPWLMGLSITGWVVWCVRQPMAGAAAGATVGVTLLANTLGLWPMGVRVNLPLVVIAHLCLMAGPLVILGGLIHRWLPGLELISESRGVVRPGASAPDSSSADASHVEGAGGRSSRNTVGRSVWWLGGLSMAIGVVLAVGVVKETRGADYEVAAVGNLLEVLSQRSKPGDVVLMTPAVSVNHQMRGGAIAGTIHAMPWPDERSVLKSYLPRIERAGVARVWLASGHHNAPMHEVWRGLSQALSRRGRLERVWEGRLVALYEFQPADASPKGAASPQRRGESHAFERESPALSAVAKTLPVAGRSADVGAL